MGGTKKIVILSILVAQALVLHLLEGLIPSGVPLPGVKLGLANIITLLTIILFSCKETVSVVFIRILLGSLLGGGLSAFIFSITGGILSALVMTVLYNKAAKFFSLISISVIGALFHNFGQLAAASLIISNFNLFYYLPVLTVSGVLTGLFVGAVAQVTKRHLLNFFNNFPTLF